ncbi:hypothetical protein MY10362_003372 [Beauveria mimosiformis]
MAQRRLQDVLEDVKEAAVEEAYGPPPPDADSPASASSCSGTATMDTPLYISSRCHWAVCGLSSAIQASSGTLRRLVRRSARRRRALSIRGPCLSDV